MNETVALIAMVAFVLFMALLWLATDIYAKIRANREEIEKLKEK